MYKVLVQIWFTFCLVYVVYVYKCNVKHPDTGSDQSLQHDSLNLSEQQADQQLASSEIAATV